MGCFDSTPNETNVTQNFLVDKKQFWKFRSHTEQKAQQGKHILRFDVLGLEIVFSLENEKTVFANQNTLHALIIFFFNFSFLGETCKT